MNRIELNVENTGQHDLPRVSKKTQTTKIFHNNLTIIDY